MPLPAARGPDPWPQISPGKVTICLVVYMHSVLTPFFDLSLLPFPLSHTPVVAPYDHHYRHPETVQRQ
jgi:hypothetical protein